MKLHSLRENPAKPSVVKDFGFWWATVRHEGKLKKTSHLSQAEAFKEATRMAAQQ